MLHLITGSNGTGKTLFTLKWVRDRQIAENRPVFYNGRFDLHESKREEFGWQKIDFKNWQDCPDGAIFIIDECHNDLPNRPAGSTVPDYVNMLGEHRKRGFDFYLITQHPSNIDVFVRRLIGAPGWHKHLKRKLGAAPAVDVLTWNSVNTGCETPTGKSTADVSSARFPTEVYDWYKSAELHTAKFRIPRKLIVFVVLLMLIPVLFWFGFSGALSGGTVTEAVPVSPGTPAAVLAGTSARSPPEVDYLASFVPRVPGIPHTAPRYDDITEPVRAPRIAACISMGTRCSCYTQQSTPIDVERARCLEIVRTGFFEDFDTNDRPHGAEERARRSRDDVRDRGTRAPGAG